MHLEQYTSPSVQYNGSNTLGGTSGYGSQAPAPATVCPTCGRCPTCGQHRPCGTDWPQQPYQPFITWTLSNYGTVYDVAVSEQGIKAN